MSIGNDTEHYFDNDDFAVGVTYGGQPFNGILDRPYEEAARVAGEAPRLTVPMGELPPGANAAGQIFVIGGIPFRTKGIAREVVDRKVGVFPLEVLREIHVTAGSTYMDAAQQSTNNSGLSVWHLRPIFPIRRGLLRFDLSGLPDLDVTTAVVRAVCQDAQGPVGDIEVWACARAAVIAEATHLEWSAGNAWSTPGGMHVPNDRISPPLADGIGGGLVDGASLDLLTGTVARDWVNINRAAGYAVLQLTIETGVAIFHGTNSGQPPRLVVGY
jgi:hypothetical protein